MRVIAREYTEDRYIAAGRDLSPGPKLQHLAGLGQRRSPSPNTCMGAADGAVSARLTADPGGGLIQDRGRLLVTFWCPQCLWRCSTAIIER
jgi:hypothetical protein